MIFVTHKFSISIPIRSFDLNGDAYARLSEITEIIFVNSSGNRLSEIQLCEAIKDADGIIAGTERYTANVLKACTHLSVISRVGVGIDNIDLDFAQNRGIIVANTPNAPILAVTEHTIALIFSVFKNIPQYYNGIHQGDHSLRLGALVLGKTVGIVGLGRIGRKVATSLEALGLKITFFDPGLKDPVPENWLRKPTLEALVNDADIITLHSPPQKDNRPLLDRRIFNACKQGVVIINTARGSLINENDLIAALDRGIVSSAALDVVSVEPYMGPLLDYPQVIITPHVASNTIESRQQMEIEAVENIITTLGI